MKYRASEKPFCEYEGKHKKTISERMEDWLEEETRFDELMLAYPAQTITSKQTDKDGKIAINGKTYKVWDNGYKEDCRRRGIGAYCNKLWIVLGEDGKAENFYSDKAIEITEQVEEIGEQK